MAYIASHIRKISPIVYGPDYKWTLRNLSGEAYEQAKHRCHARGADLLHKLCFANQGVYIKLGQHIAQLVCSTVTCLPASSGIFKHVLDMSMPQLYLHRHVF